MGMGQKKHLSTEPQTRARHCSIFPCEFILQEDTCLGRFPNYNYRAPAKKKKRKQNMAWKDWGSQSLGYPPRSKGQQKTLLAWREASGCLQCGCPGKPQRANKYYLQMGRRSQGGRTRGVWGHRLWRNPTSNMMGQVCLE